MRAGRCPRAIHHLGSWWEARPQELDEDRCQRAESIWPVNKAHVKKYRLGVKMLTACRNAGRKADGLCEHRALVKGQSKEGAAEVPQRSAGTASQMKSNEMRGVPKRSRVSLGSRWAA